MAPVLIATLSRERKSLVTSSSDRTPPPTVIGINIAGRTLHIIREIIATVETGHGVDVK